MRWAERDSAGGMAQASRARKEEKQVASKELKVGSSVWPGGACSGEEVDR